MSAPFATADLCDATEGDSHACSLQFRQFGGRRIFAGRMRTVRCYADNALVRSVLGEASAGEVLVVDGGGFLGAALLGDRLAALALERGWAGIVIHGAVRDSAALGQMDFGVKALGVHPRRGGKRGLGEHNIALEFGGVVFVPGHWLYSDDDGLVVAARPLLPDQAPVR